MTEKLVFFQHFAFFCPMKIFHPFLHPHDGPPGLSLVIPGLFWTFLTTSSLVAFSLGRQGLFRDFPRSVQISLIFRIFSFCLCFFILVGWRGKNAFFVMMAVELDETPPKICTRGGRDGAESAFKLNHVTLIDFSPRSNQPKWWNILPKMPKQINIFTTKIIKNVNITNIRIKNVRIKMSEQKNQTKEKVKYWFSLLKNRLFWEFEKSTDRNGPSWLCFLTFESFFNNSY